VSSALTEFRFFRRLVSASEWAARRYTPLGRLLLGLLIGAAIFATDALRSQAAILLAALLALFLSAALWGLTRTPLITCERRITARTQLGITTPYSILLHNRSRQTLYKIRVRDSLRKIIPTRADFTSASDAVRDNWFDRRVGFLRWWRLLAHLTGGQLAVQHVDALASGELLTLAARSNFRRSKSRGQIRSGSYAAHNTKPQALASWYSPACIGSAAFISVRRV
jgi:hypothetical protein